MSTGPAYLAPRATLPTETRTAVIGFQRDFPSIFVAVWQHAPGIPFCMTCRNATPEDVGCTVTVEFDAANMSAGCAIVREANK